MVGLCVDLDVAIVAGVSLSVFSLVVSSQLTASTVGRISTKEDVIFFNKQTSTGTQEIDMANIRADVKIFFFPAQLHFANADKFKNELFQKILNPTSLTKTYEDNAESNVALNADNRNLIKAIIIDSSAITCSNPE